MNTGIYTMTLSLRVFRSTFIKTLSLCAATLTLIASTSASAATKPTFEITPFIGYMASSDLQSGDGTETLTVDAASHYGIAFAWQESPKGQGQILINKVSHKFEGVEDASKESLDITYAHFNGVAQFRQNSYVTTFSVGLGGAYFDTDATTKMVPSATVAIGTRYEFSNSLALVTEVRAYASLVDKDDEYFCKSDTCSAQFDSTVWMESALSVGIAYRF